MSEDKDKWCWTRIGEARQRNKDNFGKCMSEILQILLEAFLVFIFFVFENLIAILFLFLGIYYINDCPIRSTLPISLITFGAFGLINGVTIQVIRSKCVNLSDEKDGFATLAKIILFICSIGTFIAFIWASIAVYGVYSDVTTHTEGSNYYCNYNLYWTAFVFITICFVLFIIVLFIFCCLLCSIICCGGAIASLSLSSVPAVLMGSYAINKD